MTDLFNTGIRPAIDEYLAKKSQELRDYGEFWSASSAGYCHRKLMFERLGVPPVQKESDARKQRVFEAGHVFHEWAQRITKNAGLSIAQELELQDDDIMVRGHIDDLVLVGNSPFTGVFDGELGEVVKESEPKKLVLYDYKTQHANAFTWQKGRPPSHFHRMQAGTYMYMLRKNHPNHVFANMNNEISPMLKTLSEARILKISKDDLRMDENQILWTPQLEKDVVSYWKTLNGYWSAKKLPKCTCADYEGGFMAKEQYNPFYYDGEPCSIELYKQWKLEQVKEKV